MSQELQPTLTTSPAQSGRRLVTVSTPTASLRRELRGPALWGAAILVAFFVGGGGWAATAPLSGAAIAPGVVSPEGSRRRVQHLEGGIVHEILVKDGDRVEAGDVLMTSGYHRPAVGGRPAHEPIADARRDGSPPAGGARGLE